MTFSDLHSPWSQAILPLLHRTGSVFSRIPDDSFSPAGTNLVFVVYSSSYILFSNRAPGVTAVPCAQELQPPSCLILNSCVTLSCSSGGYDNTRVLYYPNTLDRRTSIHINLRVTSVGHLRSTPLVSFLQQLDPNGPYHERENHLFATRNASIRKLIKNKENNNNQLIIILIHYIYCRFGGQ